MDHLLVLSSIWLISLALGILCFILTGGIPVTGGVLFLASTVGSIEYLRTRTTR